MNIVIIEDERVLAEDIADQLSELLNGAAAIVQLHSVKESVDYFRTHPLPNLIFSDIQLGDGLGFEIFVVVPMSVPVIFCTAYDEYAIEAFKANGIDYILKPFTKETLSGALQKYSQLKRQFTQDQALQYQALMKPGSEYITANVGSVLVYHQDKIVPIKIEDVALCYVANEVTHLLTFSGITYYPNKNLDELERIMGALFFRANRQYLVSRKAIADISSFFSRKLSLNLTFSFPERITVSKEKATSFLDWLARAK